MRHARIQWARGGEGAVALRCRASQGHSLPNRGVFLKFWIFPFLFRLTAPQVDESCEGVCVWFEAPNIQRKRASRKIKNCRRLLAPQEKLHEYRIFLPSADSSLFPRFHPLLYPFLFFVAGHADLVYGSNVGSTRDGVRFRRVQEGLELNTRGENRDYQDRSLHWQGREEKMQCIHVKQR